MEVKLVSPPTDEQVLELAQNMREEDVEECLASGFESALDAVTKGVAVSSQCWTCLVDGRVLGMFGLTSGNVLAGEMTLWLLTTDMANHRPKTFVRIARECLVILKSRWSKLSLGIDNRHLRALRFATRSGFTSAHTYPHPLTGEPFTLVMMGD